MKKLKMTATELSIGFILFNFYNNIVSKRKFLVSYCNLGG